MFSTHETEISGFVELRSTTEVDIRGSFTKTFHRHFFAENGLPIAFGEQYYTISKKGTLRGLHFQLPPHDHAKLVYCVLGEILDVAVDLRTDSPTFRRHGTVTISAEKANEVLLVSGLAHGFYVLSETAIVVYNVTSTYAPDHDTGIHWNSVGVQWPGVNPIISERDKALPMFSDFRSPFRMQRST
jgi:dTDP-4-dehydrorhamnose 3,5-epimerase